MNFDHAFVVGMAERSPKRLNRFYKSCGIAGIEAEHGRLFIVLMWT